MTIQFHENCTKRATHPRPTEYDGRLPRKTHVIFARPVHHSGSLTTRRKCDCAFGDAIFSVVIIIITRFGIVTAVNILYSDSIDRRRRTSVDKYMDISIGEGYFSTKMRACMIYSANFLVSGFCHHMDFSTDVLECVCFWPDHPHTSGDCSVPSHARLISNKRNTHPPHSVRMMMMAVASPSHSCQVIRNGKETAGVCLPRVCVCLHVCSRKSAFQWQTNSVLILNSRPTARNRPTASDFNQHRNNNTHTLRMRANYGSGLSSLRRRLSLIKFEDVRFHGAFRFHALPGKGIWSRGHTHTQCDCHQRHTFLCSEHNYPLILVHTLRWLRRSVFVQSHRTVCEQRLRRTVCRTSHWDTHTHTHTPLFGPFTISIFFFNYPSIRLRPLRRI